MSQAAMRSATSEERARRSFQTAADTAERAGAYVHAGMSRGAVDGWTREAQEFLRRHPLRVLAIAAAAGYVAGKILLRRD